MTNDKSTDSDVEFILAGTSLKLNSTARFGGKEEHSLLPAKSSASLKQMSFFGIRAQHMHKTKILMSPNSSHADINNLVNI